MIAKTHFIKQQINSFKTIIIHGHKRPDGDCYGSQLGLKDIIEKNFKDKKVYVIGETNDKLSFLGKMDEVKDEIYHNALAIVVDCGNVNVISDPRYKLAKMIIRIDHHLFYENYGHYEWVDDSFSSCSEMIYYFKEQNNLEISAKGALPIYVGMVTDTGNFRFDRVNQNTLKIASHLLNYGINPFEIDKKISSQNLNILRFKSYILSNFKAEKGLIYIQINQEIMINFNLTFEDVSSLVNIFHNIENYPVWLFIIEHSMKNHWKISIRSIGPQINHIAAKFQGGGHFRACGVYVTSQKEIDEIIKLLQLSVNNYMINRS
ncbi:DHH family phosphoesterase [Candidatus Phytoplasma melaleucae]|uniref:Bifunctional oligoribonuclease/PAP phosphatase NrnA n=1 Tax=Candidatus Phytoplasma melaleucae TaxID=2982630 RepID=A0ABT9DDC3_9MOLU|nr:bifunctional oligoribonuclease/PAP phosphatase NrnA ['Melaleuca sp.' phytoplasma]MDO8168061.1 bifunctional oligoribonuclease/PAP phosphatase NrnA ['Melaleuca sp.' phytoplasma]MDV3205342.1 bifunctional oligoribonuclease/PAP phosphatase NrnA [Weeping tea tree witches'-broom phytoplasma]